MSKLRTIMCVTDFVGTGKTTVSKLFAKHPNIAKFTDVKLLANQ